MVSPLGFKNHVFGMWVMPVTCKQEKSALKLTVEKFRQSESLKNFVCEEGNSGRDFKVVKFFPNNTGVTTYKAKDRKDAKEQFDLDIANIKIDQEPLRAYPQRN
jgi:hypothetical protein